MRSMTSTKNKRKRRRRVATNKNIKLEEDCKLLSWNVNGLLSPSSNREEDSYKLKEKMTGYDIVCLQDVRIKMGELRDVRRNFVGRNSYLIAGLRKYKRGKKYPAAGGVMMVINSNMKGAAYEQIEDERRLGRYCGVAFQTPGQHLTILNVYFPTTQISTEGDGNTRHQNEYMKRMGIKDESPQSLILGDITKIVEEQMNKGRKIIIVGDLNLDWQNPVGSTGKVRAHIEHLKGLGIISTHKHLNIIMPRTYRRITRPDWILLSSVDTMMYPTKLKAIEIAMSDDHRALEIGLIGEIFRGFRETPPEFISNAIPNLKDEKECEDYNEEINKRWENENLWSTPTNEEEGNEWMGKLTEIVNNSLDTIKPQLKGGQNGTKMWGTYPGYEQLQTLMNLLKSFNDTPFGRIENVQRKLERWNRSKFRKLEEEIRNEVKRIAFELGINHLWSANTVGEVVRAKRDCKGMIKSLGGRLHRRRRKQNISMINEHIKRRERNYEEGKLGRVITSILDRKPPNRIDSIAVYEDQILIGRDKVAEAIAKHFKKIFTGNRIKGYDERAMRTRPLLKEVANQRLMDVGTIELSIAQILKFINLRPRNKAPGSDGVTINALIAMEDEKKVHLSKVIGGIIMNKWIIKEWKNKWIIPVPKIPDTIRIDRQRPISLLQTMRKITLGSVSKKMSRKVDHLLMQFQMGFRKGRRTDDALARVRWSILAARENDQPWIGLSIDFKGAFDNVPYGWIVKAGERLGFDKELMEWFVNYEREGKSEICIEQKVGSGHYYEGKQGTPQGSTEGPQFFIWFLDILLRMIEMKVERDNLSTFKTEDGEKIFCSAFADDLIVFSPDYNTVESLLSVIEEFTGGTGMKLSKAKSILAFNKRGRRKLAGTDYNHRFKDFLKCNEEESFKYLGHQLSPSGRTDDEWEMASSNYTGAMTYLTKAKASLGIKRRIVRIVLIPRILYKVKLLSNGRERLLLHLLQQKTKKMMKRTLKLPQTYPDGLLYAPLGEELVPKLSWELAAERIKEEVRAIRKREAFVQDIMDMDEDMRHNVKIFKASIELEIETKDIEYPPPTHGVKELEIWSDGSVTKNRGEDLVFERVKTIGASAGVYISEDGMPKYAMRSNLNPATTKSSYRSELAGVFIGLEKLVNHKEMNSVRLILDNQAVVNNLNNLEETVARSLSGGRVGHSLWMEINQMVRSIKESEINLEFVHIMGHPERRKEEWEYTRDERGNQISDRIAAGEEPFSGLLEVEQIPDPSERCELIVKIGGEPKGGNLKEEIIKEARNRRFKAYLNERDSRRENERPKWSGSSVEGGMISKEWKGAGRSMRLLFDWTPHRANMKYRKYKDEEDKLYTDHCPLCEQRDGTKVKDDEVHWILSCPSTEEKRKAGLRKLVETMSIAEVIKLREILGEGGEKATWIMKGLVRKDWIDPEMATKIIKGSKKRIIELWEHRNSQINNDE